MLRMQLPVNQKAERAPNTSPTPYKAPFPVFGLRPGGFHPKSKLILVDYFNVAGFAIMLRDNLFVKLNEAKRATIQLNGPRNVDSGRSKCRPFAEFLGLVRRQL